MIKCLSLFVDDKKSITAIYYLYGIEIIFRILNNSFYLSEETKELLINYIYGMDLSEEEEKIIPEIIADNEVIERLLTKAITSLKYPRSQYVYGFNEEILITPTFNGNKCEFSI